MNKIISIIFCAIFIFTLCGCKSNTETISVQYSYCETDDDLVSSVLQNASSINSQKKLVSTVSTPSKVVFYKNGQEVVSTEREQNKKIAQYIESYFKGQENTIRLKTVINNSAVAAGKGCDMAIEVFFDAPTTFYGGVLHKTTTTLFIPIDGEKKGMLVEKSGENDDHASGPLRYDPKGLEKFFPTVFNNPEELGIPEYCAVKTKYKTVGGKYVTTEKAEKQSKYDANDLYVFKNSDGVIIKKDAKTGEIAFVDFGVKDKSSKTLTQELAKEIAETNVKMMFDISAYDKQTVETITNGMSVVFMKTISGFDTCQYIKVVINGDKTVKSIEKTPNMFDKIDTTKISVTEEQIMRKVEQQHAEKYSEDFFDLKPYEIEITIKDAKPQVRVYYQEFYRMGNEHVYGKLIETYINL